MAVEKRVDYLKPYWREQVTQDRMLPLRPQTQEATRRRQVEAILALGGDPNKRAVILKK